MTCSLPPVFSPTLGIPASWPVNPGLPPVFIVFAIALGPWLTIIDLGTGGLSGPWVQNLLVWSHFPRPRCRVFVPSFIQVGRGVALTSSLSTRLGWPE
ncbi:hypothetical protein C0992_004872 [Termitomyces sp. T32_za158]|nr:hypothetical protein C0992_004872 [Termitomyces sp. T32_za158]